MSTPHEPPPDSASTPVANGSPLPSPSDVPAAGRPTPDRPPLALRLARNAGEAFTAIVLALFTRLTVTGGRRLPRHGPVVLVANHPSWLDPPLLYLATLSAVGRRVGFMADHYLFDLPLLGPLIPLFAAFPVNQESGPQRAYQQTVRRLRAGEMVGIFPEGQRSTHALMWPPLFSGAVRAAAESGAPIVPVSLIGPQRVWPIGFLLPRPAAARIEFHPPVRVPRNLTDAGERGAILEQLRATINAPIERSFRCFRRSS